MKLNNSICFVAILACFSLQLLGGPAIPNVNVVNAKWPSLKEMWVGAEPLELPLKVTIELSSKAKGVISGFVCEYHGADLNLFNSLKDLLQKELGVTPKFENPGKVTIWRDEVAKRTITLTVDESGKNIQIVVVSLEKGI